MRFTLFIICTCLLIMSCGQAHGPHDHLGCICEPELYEHDTDILKSKREIIKDGNTVFLFALQSGETHTVTYGQYEKYEPNDTICFERKKGYITWNLKDCNDLNPNTEESLKPRLEN